MKTMSILLISAVFAGWLLMFGTSHLAVTIFITSSVLLLRDILSVFVGVGLVKIVLFIFSLASVSYAVSSFSIISLWYLGASDMQVSMFFASVALMLRAGSDEKFNDFQKMTFMMPPFLSAILASSLLTLPAACVLIGFSFIGAEITWVLRDRTD